MNEVIINEENLKVNEIEEYKNKARAILIKDDKILIARYAGVVLLPGGKIEDSESFKDGLIREIKEELGIKYSKDNLKELFVLKFYQRDYPYESKRKNRLVITHFYLGDYVDINLENVSISKREKEGNFKLELVKISDLNKIINEVSDNPRDYYFDRELLEVLRHIKRIK